MRFLHWRLLAGLLLTQVASAEDGLGTYVGAGAGRAEVRADRTIGIPSDFNESTTGWTASLGIRPLRFFGTELQYFDFGHPRITNAIDHIDARAHAPALYGVGYMPVPGSRLDLYAKVGVGRVHVTATSRLREGIYCLAASPECSYVHSDASYTRFGWGAGALLKVSSSLAVRAEYSRFSVRAGAPDLVSLSLMWHPRWFP
jgi:opacity protein-like surface antigen